MLWKEINRAMQLNTDPVSPHIMAGTSHLHDLEGTQRVKI